MLILGEVSNTICLKLHMIRLSAVRNGKWFTNIHSHIFHCNHKHANETHYKWDGKLKKYEIVAKQVYYSLHQLNIEAHSPFHFLTLSWQSWCHEQSLSARGSTAIDNGIPRLWIDHRNYKTWNRSFMTQQRLSITSSNENYYHSVTLN
jgi:hypothetical protein